MLNKLILTLYHRLFGLRGYTINDTIDFNFQHWCGHKSWWRIRFYNMPGHKAWCELVPCTKCVSKQRGDGVTDVKTLYGLKTAEEARQLELELKAAWDARQS